MKERLGDFLNSFIVLEKFLKTKMQGLNEEDQIEIYKKAYIEIIKNLFLFLHSNLDNNNDNPISIRKIFINMSIPFLKKNIIPIIKKKFIAKAKDNIKIEINEEFNLYEEFFREEFFKKEKIDAIYFRKQMWNQKNILENNFKKYIKQVIDDVKKKLI